MLLKKIYEPYFDSDRYDDKLKEEVLDRVLEQVVQIAQVLSKEDRSSLLVPVVLESLRDDSDEERRFIGIRLMDELVETLGEELCRDFLMYELVTLQDDPAFKIRREIVVRLGRISRVLGEQIFIGVIMPMFRKLSQDSIWSVRKACIEALPQMTGMSN